MKLLLVLAMVTGSTAIIPNISPTDVRLPVYHSAEAPAYKRIVALADGSAEIVAALGYKNNLVGRDIASTMPELANVPIDEDAHQIVAERVLSQHPDLVILDANSGPSSAIATIKSAGVKTIMVPAAYTMSDIAPKEGAIASALRTPKALAMLLQNISHQKFSKEKIKVAFLYLRGTAAIYLIGGKGSGADSIFSDIGLTDVGAQRYKTPFTDLTSEALITLQPDVIVLMTKGLQSVGGESGLEQLPGIAETPAGLQKRFVTVDDSLLLSFGPRTGPMLKLLRASIDKVMKQ